MGHSILAPSNAHLWSRCSGGPMMALQCPESDDQDTLDGNAAHWVAAQALMSFKATGGSAPNMQAFLDLNDPAGTTITEEIIDSASVYVDDVMWHCRKYGGVSGLHVEQSVRAEYIHAECYGTPDCVLILFAMIIIWDFKHGHMWVDPIWNPQCLCYLAGVIAEQERAGIARAVEVQVEFRIAQPRCFQADAPVRGFSFPLSDAWPHITTLAAAAELALSEDAVVTAGPQCKYCPAVHLCAATGKIATFAADYAGMPVPNGLTVDGMGYELSVLKLILPILESRQKALETEATVRIKGGEFIPGWGVERAVGKRKWLQPDTAMIEFGKSMSVDFSQASKAITPSEAERRFKNAGLDPKLIETMAEAPVTGIKLVAASDSKARLAFSTPPKV